ncbi:phage tail tape measure protein [Xanthomonas sp. PPL568]|uniref:phage tail tape measure protein n=1 Tax=Xanthomonas indica TaxID=2912242 RepID=UPI001F59B13A|nr:phage tail tape measure protein [Xanthomonas indica]MCI2243778.1 phage tail tape measure protein [Xanthomonas indica]
MDIAELGYKVDSSGLVEGTRALDENAAAAGKASGAADRLEKDYQSLARTIEQSSRSLGDRLGGALDRISAGTGVVITEMQALNKTNAEILTALGALDSKFAGTAAQAQAYGAAGTAAAAATTQVTTASQQLEQQLAQQEARYKAVAQQAMAWSQGNQAANVSERALAEAARDAAAGIDHKAVAMAGAGTEQDRMAARARALQEAEARSTNEQRKAAAAADAQKINLQQLLGQIDPTIAALNRLAAMEDRLERAHKAGMVNPALFEQYQAKIDAMRTSVLNATNAQNGMGMSARQLQANLRMIPMQITDITTSIISGQPIWMVAIQQGGQLKDQLGGIGPAARAVGGYVLGLINPLTLAAAAMAALVLAAKQNRDQLFEFQKELILSGQGAVIGSAGFEQLTNSLDHLQGVSRGGAVAALTATAAAGRFTGQQFELVAGAAARMEAATGRSAAATVSAFESIAKDPLDGLLKLNDAERFLTEAQLQRIVALREEGHSQEAANEAIQLYAAHLRDVADQTDAIMPAMSRGWRDVKDDISGAWSALGGLTNALADLAGKWGVLQRLPRLSDMLGIGVVGSTITKNLGLPSVTDAINGYANFFRGGSGAKLPAPIDESAMSPQMARELASVAEENASAQRAASDAINAQVAGLDRATAKEAARLKIIAEYNKLADNDARHFDGSMDRLIASSNKQIDKQFNQREGIGKKNSDDTSAQSFIASVQRQIEANNQLASSGEKVTASDRMVIQARQLLANKTNTMTAATRKLLEALIPQLETTDAQAQAEVQRQRGMQASLALTERLTQLEKQRQEQADIDLMGLGRGSDATQMLQRQLDIQRQYLQEQEKLDKTYNTDRVSLSGEALEVRRTQYEQDKANLEASLERSLEIERTYQQRRLAMVQDWRTGFTKAWEDYAFAAGNSSEQAASLLTSSLQGAEDAFVRFVQTGKLSFKDLANSIIADLARIAAKQAIVGIVGSIAGSLFGGIGGGSYTGVSAGAGSNLNFGNNVGGFTGSDWMSYGGGRAAGGPVGRGSYYEVGENGRPELYRQGGRNYLIPGNDGTVIPMAPASGGGGGGGNVYFTQHNVVNSDGSTSSTTTGGDGDAAARALGEQMRKVAQAELIKAIRPGGILARAN